MHNYSNLRICCAFAVCTLLWEGCKKVENPPVPVVDPVLISLSLTVDAPQVKATDNSFEEGDQIGLYVSYDGDLKE